MGLSQDRITLIGCMFIMNVISILIFFLCSAFIHKFQLLPVSLLQIWLDVKAF